MAWRSSGSTNTELVDNMVHNGLISCPEVEQGFRRVDRKHFVPKICEDEAYSDRPIKEGNVHISAPHIYCTVLEALELKSGASLSFLNIGSGSGYLTCIASEILGPKSSYYGIEIHEDTLNHCKNAIGDWQEAQQAQSAMTNIRTTQPYMHFIHGNGLNIESDSGESLTGFERIYVGAAINKAQLKKIQQLLSPGGLMVAPVDDDLLKVVRTRSTISPINNDYGFTTRKISGVTFAPLLTSPQLNTIIPSTQWSISNHHLYPNSFQQATKAILLCRNSNIIQPIKRMTNDNVNFSASLPKEVWLHILSFTTRRWFEPVNSDIEVLRNETQILEHRLIHEQISLTRARRRLAEAETHNLLLQRQNEMYLQVARQFNDHLQNLFQQNGGSKNVSSSTTTATTTTGIHLSLEMIQSTQHLLQETQHILLPRETAPYYTMMMEESESDSDSDSESDEDMNENFDSEQNDTSDRLMFDSTSTQEQQPSESARQVRTVSISSMDL